MEVERLSTDFNRGYTKAIMDVQKELDSVQDDLVAHHKRLNYKLARKALGLFLEHRENFRENRSGFIRWNMRNEDLEFHNPKGRG